MGHTISRKSIKENHYHTDGCDPGTVARGGSIRRCMLREKSRRIRACLWSMKRR